MLKSLKGVYDFGLLTLELLVPENTMISYMKTVNNILMTFLAGSQQSTIHLYFTFAVFGSQNYLPLNKTNNEFRTSTC